MLQRTEWKHVKQALYMMAYGASKRKAKRVIMKGRKMTAR
ncbi:gp0.65 [Erwinia phage vB_EamP-L1]|nr:gp0.65 [Erwinia phage vB_EamP-L1]AEJ81472.1 gp0.65 [Erwinia phage vB_EamP-L1]